MKKLITAGLVTLAIASATCNAGQAIESEMSYACKAMLERGSAMFCGQEVAANSSEKLAIAEVAPVSKGTYACDAMADRGSSMFCQKDAAFGIVTSR